MAASDRLPGPDVQQCVSCISTDVRRLSIVGSDVWLVCGRCGLRWSIRERRSASFTEFPRDTEDLGPRRSGTRE